MKKQIQFRNPENIDPSTLPEGWRFTLPEEHEFGCECRVPHKIRIYSQWSETHRPEQWFRAKWTAITNAPLPKEYLEPEIPYHNPHNLTDAQVETDKGWRLLLKEEVDSFRSATPEIQAWSEFTGWSRGGDKGFQGSNDGSTYRVKWPLPAKYQPVSENKSEPTLDKASLDERYEQQIGSFDREEKKLFATVKEIEQRGMYRFLRSCRLVMADNPRHGNDPFYLCDSSITFEYGKNLTAKLLETGEVQYHDGVKMPLKTVRYVQVI